MPFALSNEFGRLPVSCLEQTKKRWCLSSSSIHNNRHNTLLVDGKYVECTLEMREWRVRLKCAVRDFTSLIDIC